MNRLIKIIKLIASVLLIVVLAVVGVLYFKNSQSQSNDNFNLQIKCSELSEKYFNTQGYNKYINNTDYKNHFNSKLNKCLILISTSYEDRLSMDLYDVLESKHYVAFVGNVSCYPHAYQSIECQQNHGVIWFDGNDRENPAFGLDQSDIKKTQEEFSDYLYKFMND